MFDYAERSRAPTRVGDPAIPSFTAGRQRHGADDLGGPRGTDGAFPWYGLAKGAPLNFHSTEQVQRFARLFMAPGVFHCGGGTGPQVFDSFGALVRWVESGEAPDRIVASRVESGVVIRARPLCAYPYVARWDGKGDPNAAESFDCRPNYARWSPPNNE